MGIESVFRNEKFRIPIVFKSDDFKNEVDMLLHDYITALNGAGVSSYAIEKLNKFRRSCAYTLSNYFKGMHSNAFLNFEKAVKALELENTRLLYTIIEDDILYRGRINGESEDYSDDKMYHIPLNSRGIISTQRYSFPGLPCIYASASTYTSWVELNRPSFDTFQVAALKVKKEAKKMRVIDLSNIPQKMDFSSKSSPIEIEQYCLYWALLAVCSIKVRHENHPFKPEYIFPQFLLEYILKNKNSNELIGIKYISNKVAAICEKQLLGDWHAYVNYVFPSHSDSTNEIKCSTLVSKFSIENNRSGRELQLLSRILEIDMAKIDGGELGEEKTDDEKLIEVLGKRKIYTHDGKCFSYAISIFGMIERALQRRNFDDIDDESSVFYASPCARIDVSEA